MLAESANEAGWHGAEAGAINEKFLKAGASFAEYKAAPRTAVERGLIALHPSSSHMTFTQARPPCSRCGRPLILTRIEPEGTGFDLRTYYCAHCQSHEAVTATL
jgi:formamidopyrimidine-DNA glycosylase